ncbi:hypothetical protein V7S43_013586 [Phytophthora oleae]|uniref:Uncharacterized protein n=1 Tax=Phytophthora oleae TaxID=2107226 RepID=A0ABD3F3J6_9STRA
MLTVPPVKKMHSTRPLHTTGRDQQEISGSTQVTKGDGNFRDVVSSTTLKSNDGAVSIEESDRNDTTNVSSHVLSSGSAATSSTTTDGNVISSTETSNNVGSEGDAQPNRLETNADSRAVIASVLSLLIVIVQAVL